MEYVRDWIPQISASVRPFCVAATSWLRSGVGPDEVKRLLGHESLSSTLRGSSLVSSDLQAAIGGLVRLHG